jgi:hypothetical protein
VVLLKKLLNNLAFHSPAILSKEEGEKHPKELEVLISLGILKQDTFPQERWCSSCENEFVPIQIVSKERAFTLCTMNEEATRDYFDPQTLKQWRFDTLPFISLFLKALGIDQPSPTENIAGLLWDLGNHNINGGQYHLFFTRGVDDIEKDKRSIITSLPSAAVFYLGAVHTSLSDEVLLVPLLDIIKDIQKDKVVLNTKSLNTYFPKEIYTDKGGDLQLDKHIVLSLKSNMLYFQKRRGGGFKKQKKIPPQASYTIAYLFQIRNYEHRTRTLQELANEFANRSKVSISNRINIIKKMCTKNEVKQILQKDSNKEWGLNPKLDCCK